MKKYTLKTLDKMKKLLCSLLLVSSVSNSVIIFAAKPDFIGSIDIYDNSEIAQFPGGTMALMNYLAENIKYPEKAKEQKIQGTVNVRFTIEKDGSINSITISKSLSSECDEEAKRVIASMPKWIPAKENDDYTKTHFTLPIAFKYKK